MASASQETMVIVVNVTGRPGAGKTQALANLVLHLKGFFPEGTDWSIVSTSLDKHWNLPYPFMLRYKGLRARVTVSHHDA